MLSFQQRKNMADAAIFYKPISTPSNAPLSKTWWYIGASLAGKTLKAQVASLRDVAAPIISLQAAVASTDASTYGQLVLDGYISYVPSGCLATDVAHLNSITVKVGQPTIAVLSPAVDAGGDATFYWDCRIEGIDPRVLCAGEFIVTGGVTEYE